METLENTKLVEALEKKYMDRFNFVPNLAKQLFTHPQIARIYTDGALDLTDHGLLTEDERQIVYLTISAFNECHYCTAAHTFLAKDLAKLDEEQIKAVKSGKATGNERYDHLSAATRLILEKRGHLNKNEIKKLMFNGIDQVQVYEIIGQIALKTITNYTNHIAKTKIDNSFK